MTINIRKKTKHEDVPFARYETKNLGLEKCRTLEYLLTNGLGGYCSSTILGLDTRKYHGLLVSSDEELNRTVLLHKLEEEIISGKQTARLSVNEFSGGTLTNGYLDLEEFRENYHAVSFHYNSWSADVVKRISMVKEKNAVIVNYKVANKMLSGIRFKVNLLVNSRSIYELSGEGKYFEVKHISKNVVKIKSDKGFLTVYSDKAVCSESNPGEKWIKNMLYSEDKDRGDSCIEDLYYPAYYYIDVAPLEKTEFVIVAIGYDAEEKTEEAYKELSKGYLDGGRILGEGPASSLMALFSAADSFVVKKKEGKTIIAGYHWFGEWGRDAMISLPGATLINNHIVDAELIFKNFLDKSGTMGIANRIDGGDTLFSDYDSTLWLIDRLKEYYRYAGDEKTKALITPYWNKLKGFMNEYGKLEKNGFIMHKSGTWMDTLQRNNAVEVQALWYNALKVMGEFAHLMRDKKYNMGGAVKRFERNFYDVYWNGRYLNDCLGDESLRPNQIIAISLDYHTVPKESCKKILSLAEKELLTPVGLRTLNREDLRYRGHYFGNIPQREDAYHNGTVWPWLLGPYVKAQVKYNNNRKEMRKLLEGLFELQVRDAGIGSISEILDGDKPHTPRGCISQAWSVAEPLRAYMEDVLKKKAKHRL